MLQSRALSALLLFAIAAPGLAQEAKPKSALEGLGVIGASVSAGHGTKIDLAAVLDAGIELEHGRIYDKSTAFFSRKPLERTKKSIARLNRKGCSVVVGVDLFFWFVYKFPEQAQRKAELEQAFAALSEWKVTLLVGDVPLLKSEGLKHTPTAAELEELNAMITTWAAKHSRVHVLPFAETLTRMRAGEPITLGGREVTRDPQELFQEDQLHVTVKGQALLGIMTLEALQAALPELPRTAFVQDLAAFEGTLLKLEHTLAEESAVLRGFGDLSQKPAEPITPAALEKVARQRLKSIDFKAALERLVAKGSLVVKDGVVQRG